MSLPDPLVFEPVPNFLVICLNYGSDETIYERDEDENVSNNDPELEHGQAVIAKDGHNNWP